MTFSEALYEIKRMIEAAGCSNPSFCWEAELWNRENGDLDLEFSFYPSQFELQKLLDTSKHIRSHSIDAVVETIRARLHSHEASPLSDIDAEKIAVPSEVASTSPPQGA